MRYVALGALACLLMTTPAYAQAADPAVVAPITAFMTAFNKGDVAGAAATHAAVADLVIVDEVAPYSWHGAKAFQSWAADLGASDAKRGITDQKVVIGTPRIRQTWNSLIVCGSTPLTLSMSMTAESAAERVR